MSHSLRLLAAILFAATPVFAEASKAWWSEDVEQALTNAKDNRGELEKALNGVHKDQRKGMAFLVVNMPESDLKSLKSDFLLTNCELAYKAKSEVPWGKDIPEAIFHNDVLAYANVDEKRDAWRKEFYDMCMPIVKGCKTPSEAAMKLNVEVFPKLKLGYSTQRKAPNQSPKESIEQGKASCTGLSIVLSDACRAVCVPARLVGTPLWSNKRGNHTWVEIWDKEWHFTGACEPDKNGLNRGWFVGDAAQAQKDSFEHAIYAASFQKTKIHFPLVWNMRGKDVPAENVTERYTKKAVPKAETVRVFVRVIDASKKRVAVPVVVNLSDDKAVKHEGTSRGESADTNDFLTFELKPNREYVVKAAGIDKKFKTGEAGQQQTIEVVLPAK
jgi:hypothetical protein